MSKCTIEIYHTNVDDGHYFVEMKNSKKISQQTIVSGSFKTLKEAEDKFSEWLKKELETEKPFVRTSIKKIFVP